MTLRATSVASSRPLRLTAGIFDVDGVLLASPHERAWREALKGFSDPDRFTTAMYQAHVAGMPRLDGARAALEILGVPVEWRSLKFRLQWRGRYLWITLDQTEELVEAKIEGGEPITLTINGVAHELRSDRTLQICCRKHVEAKVCQPRSAKLLARS